jgi:LPXTG-motif cell wall-anchored protein
MENVMSHPKTRRTAIVTGLLAPVAVAGLALAPSASAALYPPVLPDTEVQGVTVETQVLGTTTSLATTGAEVLPYVAAGSLLLGGGAALVLVSRRRAGALAE